MNILRYALKNIFRNVFLSLSSVLIMSLLAFFVNILFLVLFVSDHVIENINERISITLNFQDSYDIMTPRAQIMARQIANTFSGIELTYTSREKAFEILKSRNPELASLIEWGDKNPLPNSIQISNISLNSYDALNTYISSFRDILQYDAGDMNKKLLDYRSQYTRIAFVVRLLQSLEYGVYALLGLFAFTVFVIINMIISNFVYYKKDELKIIELVGGKPIFIYGPFVIQGIIYVLTAVLVVYALAIAFHSFAPIGLLDRSLGSVIERFYAHMGVLFPYEMVVFGIIGAVSAFLASYLYVHSSVRE